MIDIKEIRNNLELIKENLKKRNSQVNIDELILIDKNLRKLISDKERLESEKKLISKSKDEKNFLKSKKFSEEISSLDIKIEEQKKKRDNILYFIPNIALKDVPIGKNESDNKIIREVGKPKEFNFKIKSHVELLENKNMIDFDISSKLSGSRFSMLKGKLSLLERALINFMLDLHTIKFHYEEISPPLIVNEEVMFGTGQLPKFENDQYQLLTEKNKRKFLIPTAEVVLTNIVRDKLLDSKKLPLRFVASTPCFRKEAGSYGKDTKGLMRQHQFYKVELVSIVEPSKCQEELNRMLGCAEEILKILKIPYRVVLLSTGDMGFSAEKTFDIEVWIPSENKYREISSCSSCGTFQARRMNAKYKSKDKRDFVGTLNGSGLAVGRLLIALIENNQNDDGSIKLPKELSKYTNNLTNF